MFPVHLFSLSTISWIAFSATLGSACLIFSYRMLFWPLTVVASLPFCIILDPDFVSEFYEGQNVRYAQKLCPWKCSICLLRSYHYLPMLVIYPEKKFVALTHLFCGARVLVFSSQNLFLIIPRLVIPRNCHWSLVPYRKLWVHFRVVRGKRPVRNPLVSVFQPPECTRCPTPICL